MADAETIIDVAPPEMSDEELEQAINPPKEEEIVEVIPTEEVKEEPKEEVKEEPPPEEFKVTKEDYEKLLRRVDEKEKFIQKQADEVGKRRKSEEQLRNEVYTLKTQLAGDGVNHVEAMEIQNAIRERETQLGEAELRTITEFNRNTVKTFVQDPESLLDDMVEIVKEDGQPEEAIRAFRDNPYKEPPGTLINLAKRAELRRELRNKDARIASLEAELASSKSAPKDVVKKIEKALREPSQMSNNSGQASSTKQTIDASQIPRMTDAELERLIKESS